ncbi:MAG: hypothetical protein OCC46_06615 [Pseudodesulfovibrio sp.]
MIKKLLMQFLIGMLLCGISYAQPKKIIVLETMESPILQDMTDALLVHLETLGYKTGDDLEIVRMNGMGDLANCIALLKEEIAKGEPELVVSVATYATQAAIELLGDTDVPIVFMSVSDPIGSGITKTINSPTGTNITGIVFSVTEKATIGMMLNTLSNFKKQRPLRFGVVVTTYPAAAGEIRRLKEASESNPDIQFVFKSIPFRSGKGQQALLMEDAVQAIQSLKGQVDFMWQPSSYLGVIPESGEMFVKAAAPTPFGFTRFRHTLEAGALLSAAPNLEMTGIACAEYVNSILTGTDPGTLYVVAPGDMDVGLNLKTAKSLKLVIPMEILELAEDGYIQ